MGSDEIKRRELYAKEMAWSNAIKALSLINPGIFTLEITKEDKPIRPIRPASPAKKQRIFHAAAKTQLAHLTPDLFSQPSFRQVTKLQEPPNLALVTRETTSSSPSKQNPVVEPKATNPALLIVVEEPVIRVTRSGRVSRLTYKAATGGLL